MSAWETTRRGELHRIAAAVHIGFIRMTGKTLDAFDRIPAPVLAFVGQQLKVGAPELGTYLLPQYLMITALAP